MLANLLSSALMILRQQVYGLVSSVGRHRIAVRHGVPCFLLPTLGAGPRLPQSHCRPRCLFQRPDFYGRGILAFLIRLLKGLPLRNAHPETIAEESLRFRPIQEGFGGLPASSKHGPALVRHEEIWRRPDVQDRRGLSDDHPLPAIGNRAMRS